MNDAPSPIVPYQIQAVGIQETSTLWFEKVSEEPGGNTRQRFITRVATLMQRNMHEDLPLSYPGHNGFSLNIEEYDNASDVRSFLQEAVAYGVLLDFPHTTKSRDRKPRRKWYFNPIFSPHFRLPHIHTKEPIYVTVGEVRKWIRDAQEGLIATTAFVDEEMKSVSEVAAQGDLF
jgi:hypothetical protein